MGKISMVEQPAACELYTACRSAWELCLGKVVLLHLLSTGCCERPSMEELQVLHFNLAPLASAPTQGLSSALELLFYTAS